MTSIIFELTERWDVDGIELDFMRHPAFFRVEEAYSKRDLLTEFIDNIKSRIDLLSAKPGKQIDLLVRVPPTLSDCKRIGIDVETWVKSSLISIVVAGSGNIPFEMPMKEFVEIADGTDCKIYGCLEGLRGEKTLRAIVQRYWEAGVSGIYLFNLYSMSNDWKRNVLGILGNPNKLQLLNKRYEIDLSGPTPTSQVGYAFQNAIPKAQLPVTFDPIDKDYTSILQMDIADDLESANTQGVLSRCILRLGFSKFESDSNLLMHINGTPVDWSQHKLSYEGWSQLTYDVNWSRYPSKTMTKTVPGAMIQFEVESPPLKHGLNSIKIQVYNPGEQGTSVLLLKHVDLTIEYNKS